MAGNKPWKCYESPNGLWRIRDAENRSITSGTGGNDARDIIQGVNNRDALLLGCKAFVRWVDDCWGASEILHPETRREYEAVKIAIKNAEKSR